jgi:hypothetical protein
MEGLRKELIEKIDKTHMDLRAIRTYIDTRTKSPLATITSTKKHLHEKPPHHTKIPPATRVLESKMAW